MNTLRCLFHVLLFGPLSTAIVSPANAAQIGSVTRVLKIGDQAGGFGPLRFGDFFGGSVAALGDVNGDGVGDLAVGASGDDDGGSVFGAIWILFLRPDGSVQAHTKISQSQGGFTGTLSALGVFGRRLAALGDLDGDGITELATTSRNPNRLWILFLKADGTLKSHTLNNYSDPAFVPATQASYFESVLGNVIRVGGLCALGDLDSDGIVDLAVGAPGDPDGVGSQVGATWILRLNPNGTLKAAQRISRMQGGFTGALASGDLFGSSLTPLGDLDFDGSPELGVGALGADTLSRFWVVSLDSSGMVLNQSPFGLGDYSLSIAGLTNDTYGALDDLDGDGFPEVAMGFSLRDFAGGPQDEGGFALGFLRNDGSVRKRLAVSHRRGGFGVLMGGTRFGEAFASLGDMDGDGAPELAVGAPQDSGDGAVWILSLDPDTPRNGAGVNPQTLTQANEPVFGALWTATLDCSAHASGVAALWGYDRPTAGVFAPFGELLITGNRVFELLSPHSSGPVAFARTLPPPSIALIDLPIFIQGACSGAPRVQLSNALDVVIGQ